MIFDFTWFLFVFGLPGDRFTKHVNPLKLASWHLDIQFLVILYCKFTFLANHSYLSSSWGYDRARVIPRSDERLPALKRGGATNGLTRETHVLVRPIFGTGRCMAMEQNPGAVLSSSWESAAGASNGLFFLRGISYTKNNSGWNVCERRSTELVSHEQWSRSSFAR